MPANASTATGSFVILLTHLKKVIRMRSLVLMAREKYLIAGIKRINAIERGGRSMGNG
jgi:hypothetical protein